MAEDTRLASFLSDIGASELSSKPSDAPVFASKRARLDEEIQSVQLRIHQCLQTNRSALERQRDATASLTSRLQTIQKDLREVNEQLHDPQNGLKPTILAALQQHAQLQRETLAKQTTVAALVVLKAQQSHLARLHELEKAGKLDEAAKVLLQAERELESAATWLHATAAWKRCNVNLAEHRSTLEKALLHLVFDVGIQPPADEAFAVLDIVQSQPAELSLGSTLVALQGLSLLEKRLAQRCRDYFEALRGLAVEENGLGACQSLVDVLARKLLPALPAGAKAILRAELVDPLLQAVVQGSLERSLPASLDLESLQKYDKLINEANAFEKHLADTGFEMSPIISSWTKDVDKHWSAKVNERVVKVIKGLVMKAQWETAVVESRPAPKAKRKRERSRQQTPKSPELLNGAFEAVSSPVSPTPDDGWAFDSTPASPAAVRSAPEASVSALVAPVEATEDAWGFEEEEKPPEEPKEAAEEAVDDSWGFDEEVVGSKPQDAAPAVSEQAVEDEADAWGLDEEPAPEAVQSESRPSHDRQDSLADWSWEQDAETSTPLAVPVEQRERRVSRNKLGAQKVNGIHPPAAKQKSVDRLQAPSRPAVIEKYTISTSSKQILSVSTDLLADAKKLHEADFPHAAFSRAASAIQHSCIDILDYFRATMSVQHAQLLESVPALGMQFANDCDWLAREIADLDIGGQTDMAFLAMAKSAREGQLAAQKSILSDSLDEAGHFRNTSDPARFAACERAMRQITHTLERLSQVWKPPSLTHGHYGSVMGKLVNGVLARMLQEIEDQDDISESDSKRLNELCKMLHGLEALFVEDGNSSIAVHVPIWFKFQFLSELLEASLVDIMFLFEEGHLVDFKSDELIKLIRALFSDSPNRAKAIDTIRGRRAAASQ